jgi:hypothetical protein
MAIRLQRFCSAELSRRQAGEEAHAGESEPAAGSGHRRATRVAQGRDRHRAGGGEERLRIERSYPHGSVGAAAGNYTQYRARAAADEHGKARRVGAPARPDRGDDRRPARGALLEAELSAGGGGLETAFTSLGEVLGLGAVAEAYEALDWLLELDPGCVHAAVGVSLRTPNDLRRCGFPR